MSNDDNDRELKGYFIKVAVWIAIFNLIDMALSSSGNVAMRGNSGVPAHALYVGVILYIAFSIWEYYDPFTKGEMEQYPKKRVSLAMGYAFMIGSIAMLADALVLPIVLGIICWLGIC
jgi:hypothetical protein